jgi:PPM family protein phosphatase
MRIVRRGGDRKVIDAGWASAVGGRADNQDRCAVTSAWAVLSDGAGGHAGGERAAELTVATVASKLGGRRRPLDEAALVAIVGRANAGVGAARRRDSSVASMAATVTVAVAVAVTPGKSRWLLANVGDSPAFRVTASGAERLTDDHNVAGELVRAGVLTAEEARVHPGRHRITRAIGPADEVTPDVRQVSLEPGDRLVLASDGIDVLDPAELAEALRGRARAADGATALVNAALARRTPDNVTVVVIDHVPLADDDPPHRR